MTVLPSPEQQPGNFRPFEVPRSAVAPTDEELVTASRLLVEIRGLCDRGVMSPADAAAIRARVNAVGGFLLAHAEVMLSAVQTVRCEYFPLLRALAPAVAWLVAAGEDSSE